MSEQEVIAQVLEGFTPIGDDNPIVQQTHDAVVEMMRQRADKMGLVDVDSRVIRPGDTLLVSVAQKTTVAQIASIKRRLKEELPALADVVVLAGVQVEAVYRDKEF